MSARSQVTITLGRSGQECCCEETYSSTSINLWVVKRARSASDGRHSDDDLPAVGGKRSVRERLESNITNSNSYGSHYQDKRQRTGHNERFIDRSVRGKQIESDVPSNVGKDDLRWKLIKKSLSRRGHLVSERRDVDLRERLSRSIHNSSRSNARQQPKESSASSLGRRIPSARSADDLLKLDSHRKSYSVALDKPRHNSPDRLISVPRHMPHSRRYGDLQDAPGIISLDASRPSYLTNTLVGEASRSVTYMSKTTPVDVARPAVRAPAPGVNVHRSELGHGEPLSVGDLLTSLGLGKYAILFQAEEVDMTALMQMRDNDLKEMGIPMGPRKKILLAVLSHTRQRRQ
ncbi:uncharacterized protein LOC121992275 isoform X1 [Zingiber officinale]|uniref:uncharacterized protein LOC121992275 isoform X1 n=1 Tax=Zingiber officinale TaxID=94328 RepID=UPI001C4AA3C4|nr:uncharacterized protein LOC121992275 isoform X1 [Zingiber officinale]